MEKYQASDMNPELEQERSEIAQDRRLVRYSSTLKSILNLAYAEAEGIRNGFAKEKGVGFAVADAARVGVSFVPVAGQIAAAAIEGASMIAGAVVRNIDEAKANSMLELNPTCSRVEWEKFVDLVVTKATLAKREEILQCDGQAEKGSIMQRVADIFSRRKSKLTPAQVEIKGLATEDATLILAEMYKGSFREMTAEGEGVENPQVRNEVALLCGEVLGCDLNLADERSFSPSEQGIAFSSRPSAKILPRDHPAATRLQPIEIGGRDDD